MKDKGKKKAPLNRLTKNCGKKQKKQAKTPIVEESKPEVENPILIFPLERQQDERKKLMKFGGKKSSKKKMKQVKYLQSWINVFSSTKICFLFFAFSWLLFPCFLSTEDIRKLKNEDVPYPEISSIEMVCVLLHRFYNNLNVPLLFFITFSKALGHNISVYMLGEMYVNM